jgi:hypothetical protein
MFKFIVNEATAADLRKLGMWNDDVYVVGEKIPIMRQKSLTRVNKGPEKTGKHF